MRIHYSTNLSSQYYRLNLPFYFQKTKTGIFGKQTLILSYISIERHQKNIVQSAHTANDQKT